MTAEEMARIHSAAFTTSRGWRSVEFADLRAQPSVRCFTAPHGFALTRTVAGESELLTLAVDPAHQRNGIARQLMTAWLTTLATDPAVETAFLEVAADNAAALALYADFQFIHSGQRKAYYARADGPAVDAVVMKRAFTQG